MTASRVGPLVFSGNNPWNLSHFRAPVLRALLADGHRLVALVPVSGGDEAGLRAMGVEVRPLPMDGQSLSPIGDLKLLAAYRSALRELNAAAFFGFTAKPNVYGSLAARSLGVPVIANITGLGTAFLRGGLLEAVVSGLYGVALRGASTVFFENPDDRALFERRRLVRRQSTALLSGWGVDLKDFQPSTAPRRPGPRRFLLVARMLRDKGVVEFVEAARVLNGRGVEAEFLLLGPCDGDNKTTIDRSTLQGWDDEGAVRYLGETDDVRPFLTDADVVVLPSYREGLPRTLIEAAAMGKPIVATDVPGCRETVEPGTNGLLCTVRSAEALAAAMADMAGKSDADLMAMGAASRAKAERQFSQDRVVADYRQALARAGVA